MNKTICRLQAVFCMCVLCTAFVCAAEKPAAQTDVQAEEKSLDETRKDIIAYGLESEVINLIDTLIKEEETAFMSDLQELFFASKSTALKDKIIAYCTEFSSDALKEYAADILEDPFDEKKSTVIALIKYSEKLNISEVVPSLRSLIEGEHNDFFDAAVSALGVLGSAEEAAFLSELFSQDLSVPQKQSVVKALGKLKADESWDALVETAQDEDENAFVRMYAAEAIGNIRPDEASDILAQLFAENDSNLRQYVVKGFAANTSETARTILLAALKDNHYKVRLEAVEAVQAQSFKEAAPLLLYRAKNDAEPSVKYACFDALAAFNDVQGVEYMVSILKDPKRGDTLKAKIAAALLKHGSDSQAVVELALQTAGDDKRKRLRYALGKECAKYESAAFEPVCAAFLESKDVATKGTGLDIYKKNPYGSLSSVVQAIAEEDKSEVMRAKAKSILERK